MSWTVILGGDQAGLKYIANHSEQFSILGGTISMRNPSDVMTVALNVIAGITQSDGGELYCLTSPTLDALEDASAVVLKTSEWLDLWNGAASLIARVGRVRVHQAVHRNERGRQTATITLTMTVLPAAATEREKLMQDLLLLSTDPVVSKVLGLIGIGPTNWVNAYRIFEVVEKANGGIDGIAAKGWASKTEMRRFKHTANSPEAIGYSARHGVLDSEPPAKPMTQEEASAMMTKIVDSFLKEKMHASQEANSASPG